MPSSKDAHGKISAGRTWESLIDRQIREAQEAGEFDNLPHQGAPLPNDENPYAGEWALAFHMLKNAGVAPPWVEAAKELNELLKKREALFERAAAQTARRDRAALENLVVQINLAIARMNAQAPSSAAHRPSLVLADELARYDAKRHERGEG